jgi:hypothetical protein
MAVLWGSVVFRVSTEGEIDFVRGQKARLVKGQVPSPTPLTTLSCATSRDPRA